ncbi:transposase [Microbacterium sp. MMO-10]|uniref:transposase n=1 Tax=Microbacterium sp. MMO-10 TaxID=3081272 RepID=UPI003FA60F1B
MTTKNHLVCDGKGRVLTFILTPGQAADTSMLTAMLEQIRVPAGRGRPRTRPDRVMADKGYPSRANRAWLRERGIAATIQEREDQVAHRRKKQGRPISAASSANATKAATWSSGASTSSSNGAVSRCVQKRRHATTTPASALPQPSTGSPAPRSNSC